MAKELIPNKVILNFDSKGVYRDGVLQYRVKENGVLKNIYHTISIENSGFSIPQFKDMVKKFESHAKKAEKISDDIQEV